MPTIEQTRIPIESVSPCCLESVGSDYRTPEKMNKEIPIGTETECKHCNTRFMLDSHSDEFSVWYPSWQIKQMEDG